MKKEITKIIRQYPKTDDCKFQTLKELWNWQIREIIELIKQVESDILNEFIKKAEKVANKRYSNVLYVSDIILITKTIRED